MSQNYKTNTRRTKHRMPSLFRLTGVILPECSPGVHEIKSRVSPRFRFLHALSFPHALAVICGRTVHPLLLDLLLFCAFLTFSVHALTRRAVVVRQRLQVVRLLVRLCEVFYKSKESERCTNSDKLPRIGKFKSPSNCEVNPRQRNLT